MLDLNKLQQLVEFADLGTLSRVAEAEHISTPSITRNMKELEDEFGVPLFVRSKNRIALNETGLVAADAARRLLEETGQAVRRVQEFDRKQKTLTVQSCAPAPLWELLPQLSTQHPGMTIASSVSTNEEVLAAWEQNACDIAILPFALETAAGTVQEFLHEKLFVCVPQDHALARYDSLTFAQINGFNFLLRSELGFWDTLCRRKMPASRFLVQTDALAFEELVDASSMPCFATDYFKGASRQHPDRVRIPLTDPEADVTFYVLTRTRR